MQAREILRDFDIISRFSPLKAFAIILSQQARGNTSAANEGPHEDAHCRDDAGSEINPAPHFEECHLLHPQPMVVAEALDDSISQLRY